MDQIDGTDYNLEYATVSIDNQSYVAKEPVVYPFVKIFFDKTISKNGGEQHKIHFRFKDVDGKVIQVVAYYNPKSKRDIGHWNKEVPMQRNNNLIKSSGDASNGFKTLLVNGDKN